VQPLLQWESNKYVLHILSVCICGLSYPACKRMRHIDMCGLSTLSKKKARFLGRVNEHKVSVVIFSTNFSEIFIILRSI
jgi:hypothetical protein